jgi:excisionase family DNA binding protein
MNNLPTFLTLDEVAKLLRCSVRHIYNMVDKQGLPMTRLGRRVVVSHDALMKWIDAQSTDTVAPQPASKSQGPLWPPPKKTLTDYLCPANKVRTMTDDERRRYFDYIAAATNIEQRRALDLDAFGLLPKTEKALRNAGLHTIGAVGDKYPYELRQIYNIGDHQLAAIQDLLRSLRMSLTHACGYKLKVKDVTIPLWKRSKTSKTRRRRLGPELDRWNALSNQQQRDMSVNEIELGVRCANLLNYAGIQTIGDLVDKTESQFLMIPKFGKQSLNELKDALEQLGLKFSKTPTDPQWAHRLRAEFVGVVGRDPNGRILVRFSDGVRRMTNDELGRMTSVQRDAYFRWLKEEIANKKKGSLTSAEHSARAGY